MSFRLSHMNFAVNISGILYPCGAVMDSSLGSGKNFDPGEASGGQVTQGNTWDLRDNSPR